MKLCSYRHRLRKSSIHDKLIDIKSDLVRDREEL